MVKNPLANAGDTRDKGFDLWVGKLPWRRKWQPTPVFLPGKFQGERRLAGYSPWGHKESDTTEWLSTTEWQKRKPEKRKRKPLILIGNTRKAETTLLGLWRNEMRRALKEGYERNKGKFQEEEAMYKKTLSLQNPFPLQWRPSHNKYAGN